MNRISEAPAATRDTLDHAQLARYRRDGYLLLEAVFSASEVAELRAAAETLRDARFAGGGASRTVHMLALSHRAPRFGALARDERILAPLSQLLGPNIELQHSKLAAKPPQRGAGPFAWHQDFAYFPHSNTDLAAVMVLLDDATPDNGCLHVLPRSHREGLQQHCRDGVFTGGIQARDLRERCEREAVPLVAPAGSVSIHHCLTLHGSPGNRSGRERRAAVMQYRAADAYQFADQVWADTGELLSGRQDGVVRCESGCWRLPRRADGSYGSAWQQRTAVCHKT